MSDESKDIQGVVIAKDFVRPELIKFINKTLIIPPEVQQQMHKLDQFVAERGIVAETFGWGLTKTEADNTIKVVEFLAPDPSKIFTMDTAMMDQIQSRFIQLLADADSLDMRVTDQGVTLIPNKTKDQQQWLSLPNIGSDQPSWLTLRKDVQRLTQLELEEDTASLKEQLVEIVKNKQLEGQQLEDGVEVSLPAKWELILSTSSAIITQHFIDRVNTRAEETGLEINFTMHHHPNVGLAIWAMKDKSLVERRRYFDELLHFSRADLQSMHNAGINFFEIRALGTPEKPASREQTTSRHYSVNEILDESSPLKEAIQKLLDPSSDKIISVADYAQLASEVKEAISLLQSKGFRIESLVEYYIGSKDYKKLKQEFSNEKNITNNRRFILLRLLQQRDNEAFPTLDTELFRARQETGIFDIAAKVSEMYKQGGKLKAKIESIASSQKLYDIFWLDSITNASQLRDLALKAKTAFGGLETP